MGDGQVAGSTTQAGSGLVLTVLASSQFLMTLDSSVMNVSMATVAEDVGTSITGIQTAITLYNPGHGDADDHGQQAGVDDGSSPSLRGRLESSTAQVL